MTRARFIDLTAGLTLGIVAAATIAMVVPAPQAMAQTRAARACVEHGVLPNSAAFEQCLSRVTRAFEWGETEMGYTLARLARDAKQVCQNNGVRPESASYQGCVDNEMTARSLLVFTDDQTDQRPTTLASQ